MQGNPHDLSALPPCPLSKDCIQYLDQLDSQYFLQHRDLLPIEEHEYDERVAEQLRVHVPICSSCSAIVRQARWMRSQQRSALHDVLVGNEQEVPSSVASIMEAVRREFPMSPDTTHRAANKMNRTVQDDLAIIGIGALHYRVEAARRSQRATTSHLHQFQTKLHTIFSVAAVVVIVLASALLFNQLVQVRSQLSYTAIPSKYTYTNNWDAAVIGLTQHGQMSINNFNPYTGRQSVLVPPLAAHNAQVDGVSHDGHNVLYHYSDSGHTYYATTATLPLQMEHFYTLVDNNAGEAIWTSDGQHVLIATKHTGIVQVDSRTGQVQTVSLVSHVNRLRFYRGGYVYFDYTKGSGASGLWRVNIATGVVRQVIKTLNGRSYFLSPDGTTIFYADTTSTAQAALYTVSVNRPTTGPEMLLQSAAIPIGFAIDNALEVMEEMHHTFQIVKLKPAQPTIDRVVMGNVAPGAIALCDRTDVSAAPICDENIALAPYGNGLIVTALNQDGSRQVWADDLITGMSRILATLSGSDMSHVQLPGWDRIQV